MTTDKEIAELLETLREELEIELDDSVESGQLDPLPNGDSPIWAIDKAIEQIQGENQ